MTHTDDFDQADAEILATTKALTDPETLQDAFCDFIGGGEGLDQLAIILGASSDAAKLQAINTFKAQYLEARYTRIVIDAETISLMY
jgi:hypothetical protein